MREESSRERTRLSSRSLTLFLAARLAATGMGSEGYLLLFVLLILFVLALFFVFLFLLFFLLRGVAHFPVEVKGLFPDFSLVVLEEDFDFLLGLPQLYPEVLGQLDPFLKKGQRFVQGEPSLFQFLDYALEVGQGLFKTPAGHVFSFVRRSSSRVSRSISFTRQVNAPL